VAVFAKRFTDFKNKSLFVVDRGVKGDVCGRNGVDRATNYAETKPFQIGARHKRES
jgi:hypothetical protein